jgi:hypothetical protein
MPFFSASLLILLFTTTFQPLPTEVEYGICLQTCLPMRKIADHKSEQVSQMVFGDICQILQTVGEWSEIEVGYDQYKGWLPTKSITKIDADKYQKIRQEATSVVVGKGNYVVCEGVKIDVPAGATLPATFKNKFIISGKHYIFHGKTASPASLDKAKMLETAQTFLGVPYLWGGKSPIGWDCSGFVQMVGKMHGLKLWRDSYQQAEQGEKIAFKDAQAGDLAFFQRKAEGDGKVIHVGFYLGDGKIIHAADKVQINTLDSIGIYREDLQKYTHYLKFFRRH